ncbi:MAG: 3-dehydroquinate synthase, partial [Lutibacter sp.]
VTEAFISQKLLNFSAEKVEAIKNTILNIYERIHIDVIDYEGIINLLIHDKKNVGGQVNFVLLTDFEQFKLDCKVEKTLLIDALDYYNSEQ